MDPNETLKQLRRLVEKRLLLADADPVAELFEALDDWLSKGGFLPAPWNTGLREALQRRDAEKKQS